MLNKTHAELVKRIDAVLAGEIAMESEECHSLMKYLIGQHVVMSIHYFYWPSILRAQRLLLGGPAREGEGQ